MIQLRDNIEAYLGVLLFMVVPFALAVTGVLWIIK